MATGDGWDETRPWEPRLAMYQGLAYKELHSFWLMIW